MNIFYWTNFKKKKNSTKRPSDNGNLLNVVLKNGTSYEAPTFRLSNPNTDMNYIKWNDHYYFVTDISLGNDNIMEVSCIQDILATYKDDIGNYTAFVERSSSNYSTMVADAEISETENIIYDAVAKTEFSQFSGIGCYIVRVSGLRGINTFALTKDQFNQLLNSAFDSDNYPVGESVFFTTDVIKLIFNPFQYIIGCMWMPLSVDRISGSSARISLGFFDTNVYGKLVSEAGMTYSTGANLGTPASYYTDFRAHSDQWSKYTLYIPVIGCIDLPAADVKRGLYIEIHLDLLTGEVTICLIDRDSIRKIATYSGKWGVPVQIGQASFEGTGAIMGTASSIAAGNALGATSSLVTAVKKVATPATSIIGTVGNRSVLISHNNIELGVICYGSRDIPASVAGRPCYQNLQIKTLSGFIKCGNASVDISGYANDKDQVNSYLNSGFYFE